MNAQSWSTYLPWLLALAMMLLSGLGCLATVLFAARWVANAYQSGPALVGRVTGLENRIEEALQLVESGIQEAKTLATKRIRREAAQERRDAQKAGAGKAHASAFEDPMVARALALAQGEEPPPGYANNGGAGSGLSSKAALRLRVAREKGKR